MFKILRVDMSVRTIKYENIDEDFETIGGRGFIGRILNDEVDPTCEPLGSGNKLIFCNGLLAGTNAPTAGRLSVGAKSPLTGTIKEANAGGTFGRELARQGLRAIVIEGKPDEKNWYLLRISPRGAEILSADSLAGLNNYALSDLLKAEYGQKIAAASIGCAGQRGYLNSSIQILDTLGRPTRAAARGGIGAVMGSKRLIAVVIEASPSRYEVEYSDEEAFKIANKKYIQGIMENGLSGKALPALGTAVLVNAVNAIGALPTNNYRAGTFPGAESISGESLSQLQAGRGGKNGHSCQYGCPIGCSNIYMDEKNEYLTSGFEFETIALNGSNLGISDLDTIAAIDRLCDDFGLDTMETGCTLGVCMEAGLIPFGDKKAVLALIHAMGEGTEFGRIMGKGTAFCGAYLKVKRIPTVKNQSLAGYDPRALKGTGVTYATSPMGADHTAGNSIGDPRVVPHEKEGQVELSGKLQIGMATFDSLGMCIFSGFCTAEPQNIGYLVDMMKARFGGEWTPERLFGIGAQTIMAEKKFNAAAGFTAEHDRLPEFMYVEALPPHNTVFDISDQEMAQALPF